MFPIEITTNNTYEVYDNYYIVARLKNKNYKHTKTTPFLPFILIILMGAGLIIFAVPYAFLYFALLIYLFMIYGFLIIFPKIQYKKLSKLFTTPQSFSFYEDYMEVKFDSDTANGFSKFDYSELYMVYETPNAFYIFISNIQAFALPKKVISEEVSISLRELFKKIIIANKFKIVYK